MAIYGSQIYGGSAANDDITIEGTSHETKTTSYVILQPTTGNVGIGTTAPAITLDVKGISVAPTGVATDGTLLVGDNAGTNLRLGYYAANYSWIQGFGSKPLYINPLGNNTILNRDVGNVGIGTTAPNYQLELSTDSAGKPGVGGLWTVVSDERIKKDIELANLDRCYEIIKSIPLKRFAWADGVYTEERVKDRHNLGWIAQDVQKVFNKAVNIKPFTKSEKIPDGEEEYTEQDYTVETVEREEVSIEIRDGKPVQVKKVVRQENKTMLFDDIEVVDEDGVVIMVIDQPAIEATPGVDAVLNEEGVEITPAIKSIKAKKATYKPLTHQVPRMVTMTRDKFRQEVIEDCLDLNSGQLYAAMYGAIQALQIKVESLEVLYAKELA